MPCTVGITPLYIEPKQTGVTEGVKLLHRHPSFHTRTDILFVHKGRLAKPYFVVFIMGVYAEKVKRKVDSRTSRG